MPNRNTTFVYGLDQPVAKICSTRPAKYLFLILSLLVFQFSFAAAFSLNTQSDTIPSAKSHRLKKDQFYKIYGTDDSSRALIDYFFSKRKEGVIGTFISIGAIVVDLIYFGTYSPSSQTDVTAPVSALIGLVLFPITLVVSVVMWTSFSRKKLLHYLKDYHAGKPLPDRIINDELYDKFLHKEISPDQ